MWHHTVVLLLVLLTMSVASPAAAQSQSWVGIWSSTRTDFEGGELENVVLLTSGDLTLAPISYWGNDFAASYHFTPHTNLDSPEKRVSIRFVAQASKTLSGIMTYLYKKGADIVWRFRLETDDNGKPSGQLAWDGAWQTRGITSSKWWAIDFLSQGTLRMGEIYHLVISFENLPAWGTPDSDNFINIRSLWPFNLKWINGVETNENRGVLVHDGFEWVEYKREPVYVLRFTDGTYEGNPYYTVRDDIGDVGVFGDNVKGEQFTQRVTRRVGAVEFHVRRRGNPADNLYVILGPLEGPMIEASLGNAAIIGDKWGWVGTTFEEPLVLRAGITYIFGLKSLGSSRENRYEVNLLGTYTTSPYPSLTYDGTNSFHVYSTTGGSAWSYHKSRRDDVAFRFPAEFSGQGIFTSRVFDAGSKVSWENISWSASLPDNTSLAVQTRSSDDNRSWSEWENVENGGGIASPAGRYFQYRFLMEAADLSISPVLREVEVAYNDISPPVVVPVTPARGESTGNRRPTIIIILSDNTSGIDEGSIRLRLDGQDVQFSFDSVTQRVSHTLAEDLSPGIHTVYLSVSNLGGSSTEESWDFTVEWEEPWRLPLMIAVVAAGITVAGFAVLLVKRGRKS